MSWKSNKRLNPNKHKLSRRGNQSFGNNSMSCRSENKVHPKQMKGKLTRTLNINPVKNIFKD